METLAKSMDTVSELYRLTEKFPTSERFNLINQINRAAVSIPSNIAEGAGRNSDKDFLRFLAIAHASMYEVETQLIISKNLGYISEMELNRMSDMLAERRKISYVFQQKLRSKF
ncbi:four helix bundle protein [Sphingobacterium chungjuense]|uniref:four helix bundle protein n=1 Tax=Sphingobacterium chungjuense TaxID=2675553 RepID=UPI00140DA2C2|nr:four helix bundle protein [Sphingobacterium chungjuense]